MLEVKNLSVFVQRDTEEIQVVQDISFQVPKGKIVGIVGESGSGKSMICTTILQLFRESRRVSGKVLFQGESLLAKNKEEMRKLRGKEIALIMQNPMAMFNPMLSIGDHFIETIQAHVNISKKEAKQKALEQLSRYQLPEENILQKYPHELSGGMLQRIMIAMAVSHRPSLLVADEPTTALDTMTQLRILDELLEYQQEAGTSMLIVSHDLGVIAKLADDLIVMRRGLIVEYGPASLVLEQPLHSYTQALLAVKKENSTLEQLVDHYEEPMLGSLVEWKPGYWVRQ
ncbi:ABC transporter ATP-binding protein [Domibacillus mangrovi]|uniref:Peptide ABC transporter ATP-binding protein n=1 Tax=Domibacillus mangrovi TaxID=1714354 RepID=A0A1Q5P3K2_9BACI|nr:ABC transporter ATP-binding protein [Domibacillus mangrovi]OKL36751.1 peptide ABC transporter ATP-binding protein [Domibacillus mangrovi]